MIEARPRSKKVGQEPVPVWRPRLPAFMKGAVPKGKTLFNVKDVLAGTKLPTVCEQALCPNRTECWARGTLAFQILGSTCTRRCGFCAEVTGRPGPVDESEPENLVEATRRLHLRHVVITSPARDDLPDQGAHQFAACIRALRVGAPSVTIEVLVPDFQGRPDLLDFVFRESPDIFNHNMETVRRLTPQVRARATYDGSLAVLTRSARAGLHTKSGLMVGLGESEAELNETLQDLARVGVRSLTVGQYLPPSSAHLPVVRFYTPEEFTVLSEQAKTYFERVMAGPRVRSSYHADEMVGT
jgi:lipoic acid synthetase